MNPSDVRLFRHLRIGVAMDDTPTPGLAAKDLRHTQFLHDVARAVCALEGDGLAQHHVSEILPYVTGNHLVPALAVQVLRGDPLEPFS